MAAARGQAVEPREPSVAHAVPDADAAGPADRACAGPAGAALEGVDRPARAGVAEAAWGGLQRLLDRAPYEAAGHAAAERGLCSGRRELRRRHDRNGLGIRQRDDRLGRRDRLWLGLRLLRLGVGLGDRAWAGDRCRAAVRDLD